MKKLLLLAIVVLGISGVSFGQEDVATASSSATILTHISITTEDNLEFGSIVASAAGGTVTILAEDGATPSKTGDLVLPTSNAGSPTPAKFLIEGEPNSTYSITLSLETITLTSGANTMSLDLVKSSATDQLDAAGEDYIYVGGTLTVGGGKAAGLYTNADDLEVTVNYN